MKDITKHHFGSRACLRRMVTPSLASLPLVPHTVTNGVVKPYVSRTVSLNCADGDRLARAERKISDRKLNIAPPYLFLTDMMIVVQGERDDVRGRLEALEKGAKILLTALLNAWI